MSLLRNNRLQRCAQWLQWTSCRSAQTQSSSTRRLTLEHLVERSLVRVSGAEVVPFLQGLTTNDVRKLMMPQDAAIYTMFLNKAGRILYDAIMYQTPDPLTVLIECDRNVSSDLMRHLKLYRVRRKIQIDDVDGEYQAWAVFGKNDRPSHDDTIAGTEHTLYCVDPRLPDLGFRLITSADKTFKDLTKLFDGYGNVLEDSSNSDYKYKNLRYELGVAEGVFELPPEKQFPLEANCDLLNGVSFNKGCYIGQELTARVHHTGVIRKRHMPMQLSSPLAVDTSNEVRAEDGKKLGIVLGSTKDQALGLLRVEQVLKAKSLQIDGSPCIVQAPKWWPPEILNKVPQEKAI